MTIHYRQLGSALIIFGNTYPCREQIKALGGRFNGTEKTWRIPASDANLTLVAELCRVHGGGPLGDVPAAPAPSPKPAPRLENDGGSPVVEAGEVSLTIRQLMDRLGLAVTSAFPRAVWVVGEIQNIARRASGIFFDLAEAREGTHANATMTVRAIIWTGSFHAMAERRGLERLTEVLQDGMQVRCLCQVQLYKDRGSVSLTIEDVDPSFTKGALALARERLLREMRAKGLDQANKLLPRTPFPFTVGLISAPGSRARSDFLDQLFALGFPGEVLFCPAAMQGEAVPTQVVHALTLLAGRGADLIVVTRGGGSAADLRWFDAAEIAYAIAACPVPVIAAIGHHDDVSVAEEICHLRQKTPTAAADFVAECFAVTRQAIDGHAAGLARTLAGRVEEFAVVAAALGEKLAAAVARSFEARQGTLVARGHALQHAALLRMHTLEGRILAARSALALSAERGLAAHESRLTELDGGLRRHDPRPWLEQGWTQLSGARGPVRRISDASPGESLTARLADGRLRLTVDTTEKTS